MTSTQTTGFWNKAGVQNQLLKPLRERSIGTTDHEPAWRQLRKQVMAEKRRRNAPELNPQAAQVFQRRAKSGQSAVMLMEEIAFEQRLPKYLLTFAAALHGFHGSMKKRHGKSYRRRLIKIELDKPRTRAFLDVYSNLDFSKITSTLRDLGIIQARGVCCQAVSGEQSTIPLTDYGIEDLVTVTTEVERYLTVTRARRRKRKAMTRAAMSSGTRSRVILDMQHDGRVKVSYKEPTWPKSRTMTLDDREAVLLRHLYWRHKEGQPWTSYEMLEQVLPPVSRNHGSAQNPNNRFSALRAALLTRLTAGLQLSARADWVKCKPGFGYGLETDRITWREPTDRTEQRAAAVYKRLRTDAEASRRAGGATRRVSPE